MQKSNFCSQLAFHIRLQNFSFCSAKWQRCNSQWSIHHTLSLFKPYCSSKTKLTASSLFSTFTKTVLFPCSFLRYGLPTINPCEVFPVTFLFFSIFSLPRYLDQLSCAGSDNKQIFLNCSPKCHYCIFLQPYGIKSIHQFMLNLLYLFSKYLYAYDVSPTKPQDPT